MIEQTRFLSTVFLGSEFKLENIYSGVNFYGKNVRDNFYLREKKPAKISCHTVVITRLKSREKIQV